MEDWVGLEIFMKIFCLFREPDFGPPLFRTFDKSEQTLQAASALAISGSVTKYNLLQLLLVTATESNSRTATFSERRY